MKPFYTCNLCTLYVFRVLLYSHNILEKIKLYHYIFFLQTMKNASCKKLTIDRSKAKKVGTLKDISLYCSFKFPVEGALSGGIILRSLAGMGQTISKTKVQLSQISGRQVPIAGATGATVADDHPAPEPNCPSRFSGSSQETYAVRFIQHATEPPATATLIPLEVDQYSSQRPEMGYALKHGTGKRTTFSQAQKDIMIEFYNRQAVNCIRAEPKDVIKAMEEAGLEVLSATQIKSWWSSYHRKNKQTTAQAGLLSSAATPSVPTVAQPSMASVRTPARGSRVTVTVPTASPNIQLVTPSASVAHATPSASVPSTMQSASVSSAAQSVSVSSATQSASVSSATQSTSVPSATQSASVSSATQSSSVPCATQSDGVPSAMQSASVPSATQSASVPNATQLASVLPSTSQASVPPTIQPASICGHPSEFNKMVTEWSFPEDFSQSTIGGRNGSNACAFICLYFGQVASKGLLVPKQGLTLSSVWREVFEWAITSGNELHDELFDHEGINVNVDEAVEIAGEECGVACLGQQKDFFGSPKELLAEYLNLLALGAQRSCHLFFSSERTMFLMCDRGNLYFVDSHSHKDSGALIASVPPGNGEALAEWIDKMMNFHWQCPPTIGSMTEVIYNR